MNKLPSGLGPKGMAFKVGPQAARYGLFGALYGLAFPIIATLIKLAQAGLAFNLAGLQTVQRANNLLWIIDTAPFFLAAFAGLAGRRHDHLIETNRALEERRAELERAGAQLEVRVKERTDQLAENMGQLRSSAYLARSVSELQEIPAVLDRAVTLASDLYGFYQVGIFLFDDEIRKAFLQSASSNAGRKQVENGLLIDISPHNALGYVAQQGKSFVLADISAAAKSEFDSESLLPTTRAQLLAPMTVRGKVIGAMDFQSDRAYTFGPDIAEILRAIADQVAIAVDNLRLLGETRQAVGQLESVHGRETHDTWRAYMANRRLGFQYTPVGVRAVEARSEPATSGGPGLHIPLHLRGQEIGQLVFQRKQSVPWTERERDLAEKVAAQVALALDNNRLLEDTRRRAAQEQTVSEISSHLNRSLDVDAVLQTAARELGNLPGVTEISVQIASGTGTPRPQ